MACSYVFRCSLGALLALQLCAAGCAINTPKARDVGSTDSAGDGSVAADIATDGPRADGSPADAPAADGSPADGPAADGPAADGPAADGPAADRRAADALAPDPDSTRCGNALCEAGERCTAALSYDAGAGTTPCADCPGSPSPAAQAYCCIAGVCVGPGCKGSTDCNAAR